MNTDTRRDVVLAMGEEESGAVAIPAELMPDGMRRDGQFRVVASLDRRDVLGAR